jgi:hypothetical protein
VAARAARRFLAEDVPEYFEEAGVFLRLSFFALEPDDREAVPWPARVSVGSPRQITEAKRQRKRALMVRRFEFTGSNSLKNSWLDRGIGILANNREFARGLTTPGFPTLAVHSLSKKGATLDEPA